MADRNKAAEQHEGGEPLYLISVAARLCEVHPQTLRMYERIGLIKPQRIGRKNRMYSDADIERLRQIQRFTQDLGVNLAGVEVILNLLEQMDEMRRQMEEEMSRMRDSLEDELRRSRSIARKE
ncbi:MAG: helix-turn-helix transcriptional regulator [Armatimonadetes bacterium]|nr:helix-turn-helix transcriptional regulator [Armatimonadota bacterium]